MNAKAKTVKRDILSDRKAKIHRLFGGEGGGRGGRREENEKHEDDKIGTLSL
jgi:hypothetical protein